MRPSDSRSDEELLERYTTHSEAGWAIYNDDGDMQFVTGDRLTALDEAKRLYDEFINGTGAFS